MMISSMNVQPRIAFKANGYERIQIKNNSAGYTYVGSEVIKSALRDHNIIPEVEALLDPLRDNESEGAQKVYEQVGEPIVRYCLSKQ